MVGQVEEAKRHCERVVRETGRKLECEIWRQQGSGTHRFDMMGKRLYKTYHSAFAVACNSRVLMHR